MDEQRSTIGRLEREGEEMKRVLDETKRVANERRGEAERKEKKSLAVSKELEKRLVAYSAEIQRLRKVAGEKTWGGGETDREGEQQQP